MDDTQEPPDISLFLASAVHDMKNSVGMLGGTLEGLLSTLEPEQLPAYPQLSHMLYETKRLNYNLVQLLAMYRMGTRSYPFDPQMQEISQFVIEVLAQNQTLLDSRGIEVSVDHEPDLVWCFDDDLVNGVISHAINNAIHYTKQRIRLSLGVVDEVLQIRIEDDGRGYPPSLLGNNCDALTQGVNFASGSTGLGLYFSHQVARLHKHRDRRGTVRLENGGHYGGGCFILCLP